MQPLVGLMGPAITPAVGCSSRRCACGEERDSTGGSINKECAAPNAVHHPHPRDLVRAHPRTVPKGQVSYSALGQKQTFEPTSRMSALPPKADIFRGSFDVR